MDEMSFAAWFIRQLGRREWNRSDFARAANIAPQTVQTWTSGRSIPDPGSCDLIADVLGIDRDMVLAIAGHRPPVEEVDPDDPRVLLTALVSRVDWSKDSRASTIESILRHWVDDDRKASGRAARSAEAGAGVP